MSVANEDENVSAALRGVVGVTQLGQGAGAQAHG